MVGMVEDGGVKIRYRFGGKTVSFETKVPKERDFFIKTLREFKVEILSVQRIFVMNKSC